jgi:hypothetical protein
LDIGRNLQDVAQAVDARDVNVSDRQPGLANQRGENIANRHLVQITRPAEHAVGVNLGAGSLGVHDLEDGHLALLLGVVARRFLGPSKLAAQLHRQLITFPALAPNVVSPG